MWSLMIMTINYSMNFYHFTFSLIDQTEKAMGLLRGPRRDVGGESFICQSKYVVGLVP